MVNVLLLGSGGREHALAWKIAQSHRMAKLFIAPGNAGTATVGTNVDLQPTNFGSLKQFILLNNINLIVVGPEEPLVRGVADYVCGDSDIHHVQVIGPQAAGARLEGSKAFAKEFMQRHGIPTARYGSFTTATKAEAMKFLESLGAPYVLKADGLAAGKGVLIVDTLDEAREQLGQMLDGKFGAAGSTVVIEEYLEGVECSVFVATDGKSWKILPVAKDYKRIGEGDAGLNTGGMGAVSPVPFADAEFMQKVEQRIVEPTIVGLAADGVEYCGFIFAGLMNVGGDPYVIEYNVRLGDPETEAVLPRVESDIMDLFEGMAYGTLDKHDLRVSDKTAVTVVCTAAGYPGEYRKGDEIAGLGDDLVFQAGTMTRAGRVYTNGGRVVTVTALGGSLAEAREAAYAKASKVVFEGKYMRMDIGQDLM